MEAQPSLSGKLTHRSRITNGALFASADGRTVASRRFRDLVTAHVADLGGPDVCSAAQASLVRRAATITLSLEVMEEGMITNPDGFDLDVYGRAAGNLRRILEALGIRRVATDVDNLGDYLAQRRSPA